MQQRKSPPYNQCATIRDLFRSTQLEKGRLEDERDLIEPRVGELQNQFLNTIDAEERERLRAEAIAVTQDFRQINQRIERLEMRLEDINDDYVITGCDDLLGPL